jgi:predicted nucleotidyltransferase component of viral defense system
MIRFHEDLALFREAVGITQLGTGFAGRLIEKDYFCSVLLEYLTAVEASLVFKGGTCLAKVYAEFYRLSEDLDFVVPVAAGAMRAERSKRTRGLKKAIAELSQRLSVFRTIQPLIGANNSTQYIAVLGYRSLLSGREESIKIEVGLREPLLTPVFEGSAKTILLDPVSGNPLVKPVFFHCISKKEAFAEKFRAALSRRDVAIRDYFDLDYAVRLLDLRPGDAELIGLVRQKLAAPGNEPVNVSEDLLAVLQLQLDSQLKAVLRPKDFAEFNLDRAFGIVAGMAAKVIREHPRS